MNFENFSIRLLTIEDSDNFYKLIDTNRHRLEAFLPGTVSRTRTLEDTRVYAEEIAEKARQKTYLPFLVLDNQDNSLVGFIDIKNIDWNIPRGELGFFIDEGYSNKGFFTQALKTFTDFCFKSYGFNKLFLRTHESNLSARRAAENCGFEIEGTLRRDYKTTSGELVDLLYYGKISSPSS